MSSNCWAITAGEDIWVKHPHMLLYVEARPTVGRCQAWRGNYLSKLSVG